MKTNKIITLELSREEREVLKEANEIWEEIVSKMEDVNAESIVEDDIEIINKDEIEVFLDRTTDLLHTKILELI